MFPVDSYLNRANIRVLRNVLVLVQSILSRLSLLQVDAEFNEEEHHRLQRGDGTVAGALGRDMLVQDGQRGG